jgi:hypothetical protein
MTADGKSSETPNEAVLAAHFDGDHRAPRPWCNLQPGAQLDHNNMPNNAFKPRSPIMDAALPSI